MKPKTMHAPTHTYTSYYICTLEGVGMRGVWDVSLLLVLSSQLLFLLSLLSLFPFREGARERERVGKREKGGAAGREASRKAS